MGKIRFSCRISTNFDKFPKFSENGNFPHRRRFDAKSRVQARLNSDFVAGRTKWRVHTGRVRAEIDQVSTEELKIDIQCLTTTHSADTFMAIYGFFPLSLRVCSQLRRHTGLSVGGASRPISQPAWPTCCLGARPMSGNRLIGLPLDGACRLTRQLAWPTCWLGARLASSNWPTCLAARPVSSLSQSQVHLTTQSIFSQNFIGLEY